ncbi:MAG: helix-turn-helix domain-containing protein [Deltaproteobacteria bacterium]|jgi:transcriptional regulator with XRE-family HTH domain|nr:helix-turn-helix domain-containing protein [Deltaproteobacteria bacterium]
MEFDIKTFAERLRRLRLESNLSGEELAKLVGLHRSGIVNMEAARRGPSVEILYKLARVLNVSSDYLLGLPSTEPPPKWVERIMPNLKTMDRLEREAVQALVLGLIISRGGGL